MSESRILNSWKEIANYLGRGVRTVQRWELQLGLPVHRPAGKDHSAVFAFSAELDQWLSRRPLRNANSPQISPSIETATVYALLSKAETLLQRCEILLARSEELNRRLTMLVSEAEQPQRRHTSAGAA
ncbi:MAG: hypothetical protein JO065_13130 [Acidobacteria bacterium]|nr:hypothetical protein [Acidobacteriota bacterium]MBV9437202.1 hypothetical protein [Acidobacteriota bacterium]